MVVSNEVLRREDDILVFSAKGCSFETDAPKLSSKIRRETTLNLSTVKGSPPNVGSFVDETPLWQNLGASNVRC